MASGIGEGALLGDRYRLQRVVGSGGMASVWLAADERLERRVAVKVLSDTLAVDESYVGRFRREARLAAGLSHPNLVKVYDFGGEGERPYLVMEYIAGETFADRIAGGTAAELDPEQLARELLGALAHIHDAGIVHRDIKPANVLIGPDGASRLTDFGIARPEGATRLTSTGLVVGTRSYMAPEVLRGDPATVRSDLYSCGVLLEEGFGESLPPRLTDLVARLGDEDPARRPESASQALALLAGSAAPTAAVTETAPTEALPPGRTPPTTPLRAGTSAFDRRLLGGLALLAALIVLGVVLLGGGDESPSPGGGGDRDAGTQERLQQDEQPTGSAEEATAGEEPVVTDTTPTETTDAAPAKPEKPEKVKPPKAPTSPPGKAKGLGKQ